MVFGGDFTCCVVWWHYYEEDITRRIDGFKERNGKIIIYYIIKKMNRNKKQTIKISESELRQFITEAVKNILRENDAINGVTEEEVLNIIRTAIEEEKNKIHNIELNDYEITNVNTNNKYYYNEFNANFIIVIYSDNAEICIYATSSAGHEYEPNESCCEGFPECNSGIDSVEKIEIRRDENGPWIPVEINGLNEKVHQMLMDESLEDFWNEDWWKIILSVYAENGEAENDAYWDAVNREIDASRGK